jgi:hypothetical protein
MGYETINSQSADKAASDREAPLRIALQSPWLPQVGGSNGIIAYSRIMHDVLRGFGRDVLILTPDHLEHENGSITPLPRLNRLATNVRRHFEVRLDDGLNVWARLRLSDAFRFTRRAGVQILKIEESFGWVGRLAGRHIAIGERLDGHTRSSALRSAKVSPSRTFKPDHFIARVASR